ncbi:MmgE/PrpD family protein [Halarchaeum sp. CBA1220]|uniref:MmgE/PrpD family protein n=1 Tax=Halarchaeum sp. CBA1220 TaxID=1853682 RepID=UPI000F3A910C|nr:MmgE/PrpD family protein [Halarchaeum sp. CBA1220]QLC33297.1 MmgE/PrpD family protein [Halarchaeum sp. CBA1220]
MTTAADLGAFVADRSPEDLPPAVVDATKRRLLDAAGAAFAADALPGISAATDAAGGDACTRWASDGARAGPASAAAENAARLRASGAADVFLAPDGPSHPSDAIPACVAAAEYADADGATLLAAVAAAYELHGELAWHAPAREHGFGPATHGALSATAGAAVALGLDSEEATNAIALAADHTSLDADATHRPVASANAASAGVTAALRAANGTPGPRRVFGEHPVLSALAADPDDDPVESAEGAACEFADEEEVACEFEGDGEHDHDHDDGFALDSACERVHDALTPRYAGPLAAQPAIAAAADLAERAALDPADVERVTVQTFDAPALDAPTSAVPETPTDAARSLPYAVACALTDRAFGPAHLTGESVADPELRDLADAVTVTEDPGLTAQFDAGLMPAVIAVESADGGVQHSTVGAYPGHPTQPMDWEALTAKVGALTDAERAAALREACEDAEDGAVADLVAALA